MMVLHPSALYRADEDDLKVVPSNAARGAGNSLSQPSIIEVISIVDDDPAVLAAISSLVRSFGWQARAFESASTFLESDTLKRTRCLVCDVQMPVIDGVELLQRLERLGIAMPTLFITACATSRVRDRVQASPALRLIEKPIEASELESWIRQALERGAGPESPPEGVATCP